MSRDRAWVEVNLQNLKHNVEEIKRIIHPKCNFMAVVKANAYGHGLVKVSKYLNEIDIDNFAVATIDEAIELRDANVQGDILILGYTNINRLNDLVKYDLIQTVVNYDYAKELNKFERSIRVNIKIDTGMHRLGEEYTNRESIDKIFNFKNLNVESVFSHFYVSDSSDKEDIICTEEQIEKFFDIVNYVRQKFNSNIKCHIQNSYGALNYPELECDFARIGIVMYGVKSSLDDRVETDIDLKPVLELKARVAVVRSVGENEAISYGRAYISSSNMKIATVTIGYADGVPRNISQNNGFVLVNNRQAPIIGRVCMDQMIIDVSNIESIEAGDVVTIIGKDNECEVLAEEVSQSAGTITNELLSRLSNRLEYYYI